MHYHIFAASGGYVPATLRLGNETYLYLDNGNASEPWVVRNAERSPIVAGDMVGVELPAEHCYLFDGEGRAFERLVSSQTTLDSIATTAG